jgi:hypothetical protein
VREALTVGARIQGRGVGEQEGRTMNMVTGATGSAAILHRVVAALPCLAPLLLLLLGVAFSAGAATPAPPPANPAAEWERLIRAHFHRYPLMEPADLYKLLHQAALGSEHAVRDTSAAREWMENELATMGPGPAEPLVDSLRADGKMVRIHLRPFVAAGGDPEALLLAFIGTAAQPGNPEDLRRAGEVAVQLARVKALPWPDSTLKALFAGLAAKGYPAVHHSDVFVEHYRPAYRVVAGALLRGVLPAVGPKAGPAVGSKAAPKAGRRE